MMKRWAFGFLLATSVTTCAVLLCLWPLSYWRACVIHRQHGIVSHGVWSAGGKIILIREPVSPPTEQPEWELNVQNPQWNELALESLGGTTMGFLVFTTVDDSHLYGILCFPYWLAALASTALPISWVRRRYRLRRRQVRGQCLTCGYDLRATPERCPECGTATPAQRAQDNVPGRPARSG